MAVPSRWAVPVLGVWLWVAGFAPSTSWAQSDVDGLGDGHAGRLIVTAPGTVVNRYSPLARSAPVGARRLEATDVSGFQPADLVLLIQSVGLVPVPSGDAGPVATDLGSWDLARVLSVEDGGLTLDRPLTRAFTAFASQAISVPEFSEVWVQPDAGIDAAPWNGASGGAVAFLVAGTLQLDGEVTARARGFRGGAFVNDPLNSQACTGLDEPAPRGAQKGEGLGRPPGASPGTGRGNVANGGGGGVCENAGGGGGANAGAGGRGGFSFDAARDVGGMGGAPLVAGAEQLLFGGAGGAGHGNNLSGGAGGNGGGFVLIRARRMLGAGLLDVSGANGGNAYIDAAGGGGAAGTLQVRLSEGGSCRGLRAVGGRGGNVVERTGTGATLGPGGGGAGGRVLIQAAGLACPALVDGAAGGAVFDEAGVSFGPAGAQPVVPGGSSRGALLTWLDAGYAPALPDAGLTDAGPADGGSADAGALDAGALDAGALDAGALDAGALDAGALDAGAVQPPLELRAGCGCGSSPGGGLLLALAALTSGWGRRWLRRRGASAPVATGGEASS